MKKTIHLLLFLSCSLLARAQITTPVIRANFGVDGELRANYYDGFLRAGNDDWFSNGAAGAGQAVIDTTGAASMVSRYLVDPNFRKLPFFRTMAVPQMSVINNRLWIDAVYIRDYNGQAGGDSTAFVMSNKNGASPAVWTGGVTSVPDKNDIADIMVHVRRAGPNKTDSLWFFGGLALQGTTGNRYFDFELYQTDIFYSRATNRFSNYGPDAGHTSWEFDANGQITKPGDVIFTAEYSNSSLTAVEARIWVHISALSLKPAAFEWIGDFVGASNGAAYGYANIRPKTAGAYYTGLQSGSNTWAGPFKFIDGGNNVQDNYSNRQFMEFSVNLSKLGLDPITLLGGGACGLPFRRIMVKTRSSTSFSSELKDFIGPFDFFKTAPVEAMADVPLYCGDIGVSHLKVVNALPSSVYTWSTLDGNFVYDSVGPSVTVNQPGTYVVTQQLLDGCSSHSADTVVIVHDAKCVPMDNDLIDFKGFMRQQQAQLYWTTPGDDLNKTYTVQRSLDGKVFHNLHSMPAKGTGSYAYADATSNMRAPFVYYRVLIKSHNGTVQYSKVIRLRMESADNQAVLYPNPAGNYIQLYLPAEKKKDVKISVFSATGKQLHDARLSLSAGENLFTINEVAHWQPGMYFLGIHDENTVQWLKFIIGNRPAAGSRY